MRSILVQIDVRQVDIAFPTFEEVLGLTDLAIMRKEAFKNFDINRLRRVAQHLVLLVAKVLELKLQDRATLHRKLVTTLRAGNELQKVVFVSTNYDILIDNALEEHATGVERIDLDYGVDFQNLDRPHGNSCVALFKPHGSLNWLFCPKCNEIKLTRGEKAVATRLISESPPKLKKCRRCDSVYSPLIVPPTFYKDLNNVFLSSIWNHTDIALRMVNHIVFCGYSFPDADMHIKYLLKRAQTNRNEPLKVTVINNHSDKKPKDRDQERKRYKRFLGSSVNYTDKSFGQFVDAPLAVLR